MKKLWIILSLIFILPVVAYQVYMPDEYSYKNSGDKLLFVVDFSNSMGEYLEHKTKVHLVKEMMKMMKNPKAYGGKMAMIKKLMGGGF